jgi:hypothetical protein
MRSLVGGGASNSVASAKSISVLKWDIWGRNRAHFGNRHRLFAQINRSFDGIKALLWKISGRERLTPFISLPMLLARDYTADALDKAVRLHGMSFRPLGAN